MYLDDFKELINHSPSLFPPELLPVQSFLQLNIDKARYILLRENIYRIHNKDYIISLAEKYDREQLGKGRLLHTPLVFVEENASLILLEDQFPSYHVMQYLPHPEFTLFSQAVLTEFFLTSTKRGFECANTEFFALKDNQPYKDKRIHLQSVRENLVQNTIASLEQIAYSYYANK